MIECSVVQVYFSVALQVNHSVVTAPAILKGWRAHLDTDINHALGLLTTCSLLPSLSTHIYFCSVLKANTYKFKIMTLKSLNADLCLCLPAFLFIDLSLPPS